MHTPCAKTSVHQLLQACLAAAQNRATTTLITTPARQQPLQLQHKQLLRQVLVLKPCTVQTLLLLHISPLQQHRNLLTVSNHWQLAACDIYPSTALTAVAAAASQTLLLLLLLGTAAAGYCCCCCCLLLRLQLA
jgi:hypothetical protein